MRQGEVEITQEHKDAATKLLEQLPADFFQAFIVANLFYAAFKETAEKHGFHNVQVLTDEEASTRRVPVNLNDKDVN